MPRAFFSQGGVVKSIGSGFSNNHNISVPLYNTVVFPFHGPPTTPGTPNESLTPHNIRVFQAAVAAQHSVSAPAALQDMDC
jgi:hypothetical protein